MSSSDLGLARVSEKFDDLGAPPTPMDEVKAAVAIATCRLCVLYF